MLTPVEEIKSKLDIIDIIQEYFPLKQSGANFKALCPFHTEKTPSFMVSREKQFFKCFGCFLKGTLIKIPDGFKNIEDVKKGDSVVTNKNNKKVYFKHQRKYSGEIYDIQLKKSSMITSLTAGHQVFVMRTKNCKQKSRESRICQFRCKQKCPDKYFLDYRIEKVPAKNLTINDYLLYPINETIKDIKEIKLFDYLTKKPGGRGKRIGKLPERIKVNKEFLKILGYWIAEGSNHRGYIRFSLGSHEEKFALEIKRLIKKVFKLECGIHKRTGKKTGLEITACNSNLANIFENLCGKGAENKHIPFDFQFLPLEKQRIILEAIFKGDGNLSYSAGRKRNNKKIVRNIGTISLILSEQIKNILLRLEKMPTTTISKANIDKKGVSHKQSYNVQWQENLRVHHSDFYRDKNGILYWLMPIRKIIKREFKGNVYNLTLTGNHSYIANNFLVANCGEGGDMFTFLQKIENIEFPEVLKILADKAGVQLRQVSYDPQMQNLKTRLYDLHKVAVKFYQDQFFNLPMAKNAREYLINQRKLNKDIINQFQIGYAPDSWDMASKFLHSQGFTENEIKQSGLVVEKASTTPGGRNYYDRFRDRIMFPIKDHHSNIVGFTGRAMKGDEPAKYINTPQTVIYNKSQILYGLDKAKNDIRKSNLVILVEGNMDVIPSHQVGVHNVVASSGTSLTPDQIKILRRYTTNIAMAFDADAAGIAAAERGIELIWQQGMSVKVIILPTGIKDPDDLIKKSPDAWHEAIKNRINFMDYFLQVNTAGKNLEDVDVKRSVASKIMPWIAKLGNPIEQDHYLKKLASILDVTESGLREELQKIKSARRSNLAPGRNLEPTQGIKKNNKHQIVSQRLLALVLHSPDYVKELIDVVEPKLMENSLQEFYKSLIFYYTKSNELQVDEFYKYLKAEKTDLAFVFDTLKLLADSEFDELSQIELNKEFKITVNWLKKQYISNKLKQIEKDIRNAEQSGNRQRADELMKEFSELSRELGGL